MTAEGAVGSPGPVLRIVRGEPTTEELAALITVVAARAAHNARAAEVARGGPARRRPRWSDRSRLMRAPLRPESGGFRAAALPR